MLPTLPYSQSLMLLLYQYGEGVTAPPTKALRKNLNVCYQFGTQENQMFKAQLPFSGGLWKREKGNSDFAFDVLSFIPRRKRLSSQFNFCQVSKVAQPRGKWENHEKIVTEENVELIQIIIFFMLQIDLSCLSASWFLSEFCACVEVYFCLQN